MAIKKKEQETKSKLLEVLKTEYRWESLVLALLAILTMGLAVLLINGTLQITGFPIIGESPNDKIFAWSVLVVALLGLALVIYPFFLPAIPELKKISWPTVKKMAGYTFRVVLFTGILTFIIVAFDIIIVNVIRILA
ncbi:conserved hypothetical protein [Alteracholeplasma palmae J233]|uniref:Preprotein translocase subunit SecE n=1 Tax=Alteracholeplasma palmae (strain ATCC 49389 / J233) TaxID=1318466 RepID=U4KLL6_ALTPJ|nr:preprotein translocase subunit SecE [Alteracholeplasma palmae]CCV64859.1 conserved hypothetical protein [Alteracholeplasma palmae J233]